MTNPIVRPDTQGLKPGTYTLNDGGKLTVRQDGSRVVVQRDGKRIVFDPFGNVVDTGDPNAGKGRTSLDPKTGKTATETRQDAEAAAAAAAQPGAIQAAAAATANKNSAANQLHGWVWVNGQQQRIVGFAADGTPIINYVGGGQTRTDPKTGKVTNDPTKPAGDTSVFGALTLPSNVNGGATFNMSVGAADIMSGRTVAGNGIDQGADTSYRPATGDHSAAANTVSNAKNQMTVAQGIQWFLNLSVQKPDLYAHLVDQLKATHYITPYTGDQVYGGYSSAAAEGMAKALADLAQVNQTEGGANIALSDFLDQKTQAAQAQAGATAPKANRQYQDPATLAYTAKQAAQAAIGRALTPAEEATFEQHFRSKENTAYDAIDAANAAQASAAAMGQSAPGGQAVAPDTAGEAQQFVQGDQFTTERQGYSALEYVRGLAQFLSGGKL